MGANAGQSRLHQGRLQREVGPDGARVRLKSMGKRKNSEVSGDRILFSATLFLLVEACGLFI